MGTASVDSFQQVKKRLKDLNREVLGGEYFALSLLQLLTLFAKQMTANWSLLGVRFSFFRPGRAQSRFLARAQASQMELAKMPQKIGQLVLDIRGINESIDNVDENVKKIFQKIGEFRIICDEPDG